MCSETLMSLCEHEEHEERLVPGIEETRTVEVFCSRCGMLLAVRLGPIACD